jgi:DNA invertase Pin-like site-specific DNA recombinase
MVPCRRANGRCMCYFSLDARLTKRNGDSVERYIAYFRVSTERQGRSGLGLEAQRFAVSEFARGRGLVLGEVTEVESGGRSDRPQIAEALRLCRVHGATLIIAKLDRLARNVAFISNLMEAGIDFLACDMPQANRFTVHILAAVAEHERELISQRTRAALAAAAARGIKLGRPENLRNQAVGRQIGRQLRTDTAQARASDLLPLLDELAKNGVCSLRGLASALNSRGIGAPRGGEWLPTQVKRVLDRARGNARTIPHSYTPLVQDVLTECNPLQGASRFPNGAGVLTCADSK